MAKLPFPPFAEQYGREAHQQAAFRIRVAVLMQLAAALSRPMIDGDVVGAENEMEAGGP